MLLRPALHEIEQVPFSWDPAAKVLRYNHIATVCKEMRASLGLVDFCIGADGK